MLNNIRNFSKTLLAKVLLVIIIIPFVFWGMGGVFSGGNTNNVAKINNESISTQDFIDFLNTSKIDSENIKINIDNNVLEELLAQLISMKMLSMEIKDLHLAISDKVLYKKIKENKNFLDNNNKFSRTKYEKFLLTSSLNATQFETRLKQNELKKKLFNYISGGIKSPEFYTNNSYKKQTKEITVDYINLKNIYKKKEEFTKEDITKFIDENKESLKEKKISLKFSKITPSELIGIDEYNQDFFNIIDTIENEISNGSSFDYLANKYNLKIKLNENLTISKINKNTYKDKELIQKIFNNTKKNKIELLEDNNYYILYNVFNLKKDLPKLKNKKFAEKVNDLIYKKSKFEYNRNLIEQISQNKFKNKNFNVLALKSLESIKKVKIKSLLDNKKFSSESVKFLYSLSKNNYTLVSDDNKNIYVAKIAAIYEKDINKDSKDYLKYNNISNNLLRDQMYSSYDLFLNAKYKIKVNEKTLERVKNYFR